MLTRRLVLAGLLSLFATPMAVAATRPHVKAKAAPKVHDRLDAVIDISHNTTVNDFALARKRSNILGVIHKASEGGDWRDPLYARRRAEAEAAGLLWGAYHFGTHQYSGADQAKLFLATARPGPTTLMALDFEYNDENPANTMRLRQAEDFVHVVVAATGRYPLIYTTAAWADGKPVGNPRHSLGDGVTDRSILARCPLWLADYRMEPQLPRAWRGNGWHFWQYAGDTEDCGPRGKKVRSVSGIVRCDRNLFRGDAVALGRFWKEARQVNS
ncbi:glycoside hydrolase family 25 protein [Telmatospirillum sp.]|uniref:glycoside hydrolase family 25 protein n=1 Tax=Telmatospirillum sp. TaxID=2079197 RepID=UPI00283C83C9|nr:glycoside hydrolase family 25 protein [Telmatospirillum sp.]MDR3439769.1 glycoside hydrolase family 25 protein [Telmatospirillum sp.]